jgi:hypothetical protein
MEIPKHYCPICKRKYTCRQNLYNHNKKFHKKSFPTFSKRDKPNNTFSPQNNTSSPHNNTSTLHNNTSTLQNTHNCTYCNKCYSRIDSLNRHLKICKDKNNKIEQLKEENKILKKQIEIDNIKMKEEMKQMRKELMGFINEKYKIHPKTFQKFRDNNGVIINNIVPLGEENITSIMSEEEQKGILKYKLQSVFQLIKEMHCGKKYPQFHNCAITNMRSPYAYKYDIEKKDFIIVDKNELVDDILEFRRSDVCGMLELHKDDLDERTYERVEKLFDVLDEKPEYESNYKKEIKIMLYNEKHDIRALAQSAQASVEIIDI